MGSLQLSVRASAVSLAVSGLLVAAGLPWHPSIFGRPVDQVVRDFDAWTLLHAVGGVAVVLAPFGAAADRRGTLQAVVPAYESGLLRPGSGSGSAGQDDVADGSPQG